MRELLFAGESWVLVSMLGGWFFCRVACGMRGSRLTLAELLLAEQAGRDELRHSHPADGETDSLMRGVRIYERAR